MLGSIELHNFKAFQDQEIELRPLTLLTGLNGMGKSSVLQSLLLLRQSYLAMGKGSFNLFLNGDLIEIGTGVDVFYREAVDDLVQLKLEADGTVYTWAFRYKKDQDVLSVAKTAPSLVYESSLFGDQFHYLRAERLGPRRFNQLSEYQVNRNNIGSSGEYAVHFLSKFGDMTLPPLPTIHPNSTDMTLKGQVQAWMGEISPGTQIDIVPSTNMDLAQLRFGFSGGYTYRATNVGFGLTYTLPVVIALLSASTGWLVLLENPEAHLHPQGQAKMGQLLALAAAGGAQVIVETHSDHILNGIRIATKNKQIAPDQVALQYFQRAEGGKGMPAVEVVMPELDEEGRLDFRPEGFFDEFTNSMRSLM